MALTYRVEAFKKHFNIESEFEDVEFCLDKKNNLIAKFQGSEYILNNQRNKNLFLSYETSKFAKKYGVEFLRAIKLEEPKQEKVREVKKYTQKEMIALFKYANNVNEGADYASIFSVDERDRMFMIWKGEKVYLFVGGRPIVLRQDFHGLKLMRYLGVLNDVVNPDVKDTFAEDFYEYGQNPCRQFEYYTNQIETIHGKMRQNISQSVPGPSKFVNDTNKYGVKNSIREDIKDKLQLFYIAKADDYNRFKNE